MIVWLASYPRSGNTFFRVILNSVFNIKTYSIYDDKGDIGADEKTSEIVGHEFLPDDFDIKKARELEDVFYIKTHGLLDDGIDSKDKVIYLIRDGRESSLSFTKHQNIFSNKNLKVIDTIYGNTFVGAWGEHVTSWSPDKRKNTLLIKFEDLIAAPISFIEKISLFLNKSPINQKIPSFDELKEINPLFFRSGKTNSWEERFSHGEHIAFWMKNYSQMIEYGYSQKIPKEFNANTAILRELSSENGYILKLLRKNLHAKERIIVEKTEALQEKDRMIVEKTEALQEKDRMIVEKTEALQEKDRMIVEKTEALQEKDRMIVEKTEALQSIIESKRYRLVNAILKPYLWFKI